MNWKQGFRRIAWVASGLVWALGAAVVIAEPDALNALIMVVVGSIPWAVYWIGLYVARGFQSRDR